MNIVPLDEHAMSFRHERERTFEYNNIRDNG